MRMGSETHQVAVFSPAPAVQFPSQRSSSSQPCPAQADHLQRCVGCQRAQCYTLCAGMQQLQLHPLLADSADQQMREVEVDSSAKCIRIPRLTLAVLAEPQS